VEYAVRDPARFHVPGHKGGLAAPARLTGRLEAALALDVPACIDGIDAGSGPTPLEQAESLAAEAWGARRTWFLLNGASEGSFIACLALAHSGERVVVQRNVHSSTIHGIVLAGLRPTFVAPELDPEHGVAHCVTPEALAEALEATPDAVGAVVVSPTYFGAAADVRGLLEVSRSRGVPLVVDEAWGAHFVFHPELPADAIGCGADLVISGTHKLLGSLTQSAMLHLGHRSLVDESALARAVGLVRTTSPSSLLLGSLDAARSHAASEARHLLDEALPAMRLVRDAICEVPGLAVVDERLIGRPGVHDFDALRLVVDVSASGFTGHDLAAALHRMSDINLEVVTDRLVVAHFGLGEPVHSQGLRLLEALLLLLDGLHDAPVRCLDEAVLAPASGPAVLKPREAYFAAHDVVSLRDAVGRISGDSIVVYPPGIANVVPGELITAAVATEVERLIAAGRSLRGTMSGTLDAIRVVPKAR
jgi:arginine decarboxylase